LTRTARVALSFIAIAAACFAGMAGQASAQGWVGYGQDAQHTSLAGDPSQLPEKIRWSTPVDLAPQYTGGGDLLTHYGSPVITKLNTVIVPVKTQAGGGFVLQAFNGADGTPLWQQASSYTVPPHNWFPPFGPTLTPSDGMVAFPGPGGTVGLRSTPDSASGTVTYVAFFGIGKYNMNPSAFDAAIRICTPITSDGKGSLYFGYISTGVALPGYPYGIPSGLARVNLSGGGTYAGARYLSNDYSMQKVVYNCAPALSADGKTVYVGVNNVSPASAGRFGVGYLCAADSNTLGRKAMIALHDPHNGGLAASSDDGTASPTIGTDGDVYYGVLENGFPSNHARGWLLHFSAGLTQVKTPGAFGWDDTASVVPATAVPSYSGSSSYLILTKYNNYADGGIGGNGQNKLAILDPNATETDPITGATVMQEVLTILGPTPNPHLPGVREWCINAAAIDTVNKCAVVNSEDGRCYRWDFTSNTLSAGVTLAPATGEAYTPTLVGPDGAVYAINNAKLFCCVHN
jgi:hypothetical protein